jgi:transcriptional regulator with XRE-family HTH domain
MQIARRIRSVRFEKHRSLALTALDAGLTPGFLEMLEEGEAVPTLKDLESLAEALEVSLSELFFDGEPFATSRLSPRVALEELEGARRLQKAMRTVGKTVKAMLHVRGSRQWF